MNNFQVSFANEASSNTDFSLWGLALARSKTHTLKSVLLLSHDSGFFRALSRILLTSPRHGAPHRGPGLSGNIDPSAFAKFVGAAYALARGVYPSGKRTPLDRHVHPGYALSSRQGQVAPRSRTPGSLGLLRLPGRPAGARARSLPE